MSVDVTVALIAQGWSPELWYAPDRFIGALVCVAGNRESLVAAIERGVYGGLSIAGHSPDSLEQDGWRLVGWQPYPNFVLPTEPEQVTT